MKRLLSFQSNSIRQKLLFWMLILLLPVLLIITLRSYYSVNHFTNLANDRTLFRVALAIANQISVQSGMVVVNIPQNTLGLQSTLDLIQDNQEDHIFYQIQDQHHQFLAGDYKLKSPTKMPEPGKHTYYDAYLEGKKLRMLAFNLPLNDDNIAMNATILIGETTNHRTETVEDIIKFFLITQTLIIILAIFAINFAIGRGLISLNKLKNLIAARLPSDTTRLEEQDAPVELQTLVAAMNDLLIRVKGSVDARNQFIANAAHQLKTPLTGLKLQAEAALSTQDIDQIKHALKQISIGSNNLARLTNQLLSLARTELSENVAADFVAVDLVKLIHDVTAEWVPKAMNHQVDLGVMCSLHTCIIQGNLILLQEMLNNLLDNAIRYNPAGTNITVSLESIHHDAILTIEDNGVGIALDNQEKVFQRFYRPLGTVASGCGLGLAIVEEIAKQHHALVNLKFANVQQAKGVVIQIIFKDGAMT